MDVEKKSFLPLEHGSRLDMIKSVWNNKAYTGFLLILIIWAGGYWPTVSTFFDEWLYVGHGAYGHGLLVLGICGYITWKRRWAIQQFASHVHFLGGLGIVLSGVLWAVGYLTNTLIVQQVAVLAILHSLIICLYGFKNYRYLLLPLFLLLTAVPMWSFLQTVLRDISTVVSFEVVKLLGIPAFVEGYLIIVPGGAFFVEKGCAGLNFFLVSSVLSFLLCYVNDVRGLRGFAFVIFALAVAVIANWVRIIFIVWVGNETNMEHMVVKDHLFVGWIIYSLTLFPLFWVGNKIAAPQTAVTQPGEENTEGDLVQSEPGSWYRIAGIAVLMLLVPAGTYLALQQQSQTGYDIQPPVVESAIPVPQSQALLAWYPHYQGATSEHLSVYTQGSRQFNLYIANYASQSQGSELIYVDNTLFDGHKWRESKPVLTQADSHSAIAYNTVFLNRQRNKRIILYWYMVGGVKAVDSKAVKLQEVLNVFKARPGASVVAIAMDYKTLPDQQAYTAVLQFARQVEEKLNPAK